MKTKAVFRALVAATFNKPIDLRGVLKITLPVLLLTGQCVWGQVGVHTDFPDASAAMEIYATDKGLLIPRVTLTSNLSSPSPVSSPATGLLVFNEGSNQAVGFYWWNGSQWVAVGSGGGGGTDFWSLTGNAGTNVGSNFLGTTDLQHFAIRTNNSERMRFERDGQILVGLTTPFYSNDLFTINGNTDQDYALSIYSPYIGSYSDASYSSFFAENGKYGLVALVDTILGFGVFSKNYHTDGHGLISVGGNSPTYSLTDHIVGVNSSGKDGIFARANLTGGTGVIGIGNSLDSAAVVGGGSGAAYTGFHGMYSIGVATDGVGVIGVGNNSSSYTIPDNGSGGAFTGYDGIYSYAKNSSGIGIVSLGSNSSSFYNFANGLGGTFAGYHGLISLGNNSTVGTGVIGVGNNESYSLLGEGSGGAFTGYTCGIYAFASMSTNSDHYGGYFATAGNSNQVGYAYVAGRYNNSQCKIIGTGTVNTIVKDKDGELIALTCPEAPEALFQDYGIGELVNGRAHIEIDPDLAINITVSEYHPLKVYVTPEGDCNGLYVTNKTANGFDVVELRGGESNITFAWQIVAQRANEYGTTKDGSRVLVADYTGRFPPAPGPMKTTEHKVSDRKSIRQKEIQKSVVQKVDEIKPHR
jgi:hypothetical protein